MGKCYPITRFLDFAGISHLYSQPNRLMERAIKKVSHGSHQSPQSHFAMPTMGGMALGPSPVRTLATLAAHRADAQKYTGPSTAEGKATRFFHGTKLPISLETKGGGELKRGTKATVSHGGEEENWAGKAAAVAFRKYVELFSESRSQVAFAVYQGMASAMPQGRLFPSGL